MAAYRLCQPPFLFFEIETEGPILAYLLQIDHSESSQGTEVMLGRPGTTSLAPAPFLSCLERSEASHSNSIAFCFLWTTTLGFECP